MKGAFLLDVVVLQGSSILELLTGEDQALLVWRDAFLVLDLCLDVLNSIGLFDVESNCFSCKGLYENLHCCLVVVFVLIIICCGWEPIYNKLLQAL